jgi:hypothetical protein
MIIRNENISTADIRRLLRDPANRTDEFLIGFALAREVLNFRYMQSTPTAVKRIESKEPLFKYGTTVYGNPTIPKLRYKDGLRFKKIVPEKQYNPVLMTSINNGTKLGQGLSLSTFTGSTLNSKATLADRKKVAKHLYLQTLLLNGVSNNKGRFGKYSVNVAEGLYAPETNQTVTSGSILDLQTKGRAVVYEVTNLEGKNDPAAAFNVASYWKDTMMFDDLILSYDTVDPSVEYTAQIIVTMPEVTDKYVGDFRRNVQTEYNYNVALKNGLAELAV